MRINLKKLARALYNEKRREGARMFEYQNAWSNVVAAIADTIEEDNRHFDKFQFIRDCNNESEDKNNV